MRMRIPPGIVLLAFACSWNAPTVRAVDSDFDAKFAEVRVLYENRQYLKLEQALASLARIDAPRILKAIESLEASARSRAQLVVFGAWARQDLRAAFAWATAHEKHFLVRSEFAYATAAARDLTILDEALVAYGAARTLNGQPAQSGARYTEDAQWVAYRNAEAWAQVDPAVIIEWARGLTARGFPAGTQQGALSGAVRALAKRSPAETFQWLETGVFMDPALDPNRNVQRGLYQAFAEAVIESAGVEAAEAYFRKQPNKRDYYMAYPPLLHALANTAPERVETWLNIMEDRGFRSSAAIRSIEAVKDIRPDLAVKWQVLYSDPPNQKRWFTRLQSLLISWAARDAEAALAFVEHAPRLTPEQRVALKMAIEPKP